jgi:hypothetical protein
MLELWAVSELSLRYEYGLELSNFFGAKNSHARCQVCFVRPFVDDLTLT